MHGKMIRKHRSMGKEETDLTKKNRDLNTGYPQENQDVYRKKRVMLEVAYDGTNYHGWQIQPSCITIEKVLNDTLTDLFGEEIQVIGASRTDSGVHANGNIAVFDTTARIPGEKIAYALNQRLPEDIRIQSSKEVASDFHPRKCESRKTYRYRILNTKFPLPTKRLYAHWTYYELDLERMQEAAAVLVGEHDFEAFCSVNTQAETTIRRIYDLKIFRANEDEIIMEVTGNGFLYNMVRIIAGTLMEVGRGRLSVQDVERILREKNRQAAGPTAPAKGLTLYRYEFLN